VAEKTYAIFLFIKLRLGKLGKPGRLGKLYR
jgi:hypothetical protein